MARRNDNAENFPRGDARDGDDSSENPAGGSTDSSTSSSSGTPAPVSAFEKMDLAASRGATLPNFMPPTAPAPRMPTPTAAVAAPTPREATIRGGAIPKTTRMPTPTAATAAPTPGETVIKGGAIPKTTRTQASAMATVVDPTPGEAGSNREVRAKQDIWGPALNHYPSGPRRLATTRYNVAVTNDLQVDVSSSPDALRAFLEETGTSEADIDRLVHPGPVVVDTAAEPAPVEDEEEEDSVALVHDYLVRGGDPRLVVAAHAVTRLILAHEDANGIIKSVKK